MSYATLAPVVDAPREAAALSHLDWLEADAIHILREVAGERERPALLFSGGKDSAVLLHLAVKAFAPEKLPFPLLHVDTGHNFPEVIAFRDQRVRELGVELVVGKVEDSIARGTVRVSGPTASRNAAQSVTLLEAIEANQFDALFGGARRDEEKARAKERIVSLRDAFGGWNPRAQRPELWSLYNTRVSPGEHVRVFPLSNWTEVDIWRYIARENIELPDIYFAHEREVVAKRGLFVPVTDLTPPGEGDVVERRTVRFRTVGDITCTCPVESNAQNPADIITETIFADVSERGATRLDDQASEAAMEARKREGYF
jgi:sulfate adenylyltransferase subunit 2